MHLKKSAWREITPEVCDHLLSEMLSTQLVIRTCLHRGGACDTKGVSGDSFFYDS